jgi:NADP-dependent 3-hydroxy acid dehydrogenase YdfG
MGACASSQHTSEPVIYRHAVITGASSGIGAALALALARQARCQNLTLLGRDMARLSAVAEACAVAMGTNDAVHTCTIDVMDRTGLAAALAAAHARVPLGLVVCNAGVAVTPAPPPGMSEKHIHTCTCTRDDIDSLNLSLLACADVNITGQHHAGNCCI